MRRQRAGQQPEAGDRLGRPPERVIPPVNHRDGAGWSDLAPDAQLRYTPARASPEPKELL